MLISLIACLSLEACSNTPADHVLKGTVELLADIPPPPRDMSVGAPCVPDSQIQAGKQVLIENESGQLLSVAHLAPMGFVNSGSCGLTFTAADVGPAKVYQVVISGLSPVDFTAAQVASQGWSITIHAT